MKKRVVAKQDQRAHGGGSRIIERNETLLPRGGSQKEAKKIGEFAEKRNRFLTQDSHKTGFSKSWGGYWELTEKSREEYLYGTDRYGPERGRHGEKKEKV